MMAATTVDVLGGQRERRNIHNSVGPGGVALHAMGQIDTQIVPTQQQNTETGDLLGFGTPPEQQQQMMYHQSAPPGETTVISISSSTAPTIVGLGKIEPSVGNNINNNYNNNKPKRKVIYVPTYSCNGGLDTKFNPQSRHARPSSLHNLLTPEEYEIALQTLNDKIKKSRAKKIDYVLLGTGPLMIPLAVWGARHSKQVKMRRKLIEEGVWEFNERMDMDGKNIKMFWNRGKHSGGESYLTIEEIEEGAAHGGKKVD